MVTYIGLVSLGVLQKNDFNLLLSTSLLSNALLCLIFKYFQQKQIKDQDPWTVGQETCILGSPLLLTFQVSLVNLDSLDL